MSDFEHEEDETYDSRLDIALWRRILAHARPYKASLIGMALSGLMMAIVDALLPWVTGRVIDCAISEDAMSALVRYSLFYLALVVVISALIWYFIVAAGRIATGYAHDLRRAGFKRLQELSFSFFDHRPVGWLMARLTSDCARLSSILPWTLLDWTWGSALLIGISAMMLALNWKLALLVMVIIPPLAVVSVIFQRMLLRSQRAVRKTNSQMTASFNEGLMGVRTTKALVREEENLGEFQVLSTSMFRFSVRNSLQAAVYLPIVLTLGSVGVGLALWRGGLEVSIAGVVGAVGAATGTEMTFGKLVAFMQYAALFYIPIQEMAARFTELQAGQASAERLQGLLDTEPEIQDSPQVLARIQERREDTGSNGRRAAAAATALDGGDTHIETILFEGVSFAYKEGEPVLTDFDLRVEAGETIALVGATGSGKSTIVSLLCRFYEPTTGSIRLNGVDYRERSLGWLQSNLGIVLQAPHLFSGSIRENIRYGRLEASEEEIVEAARLVGADEFIRAFDDGYGTDVGEGGNRLSTGQKQLISLARAVLAGPQIFVMDEATSSVDTETERLIQRGIETVLSGRISFIIAHRLSTIRSADRILVIDKGRLIEEGNHEELLRLGGHYHWLYMNQFSRESQERILSEGGVA